MERATRQRAAIRETLVEAARPLSPPEVLAAAQQHVPALSLATVYRNLKLLHEAGEITLVSLPGDSARYEARQSAHHHHFQCLACERVFDVPGCPGDLVSIAPAGFTVERHEITLYGRCADCAPRLATPAAPPPSGQAHGHDHLHRHDHGADRGGHPAPPAARRRAR